MTNRPALYPLLAGCLIFGSITFVELALDGSAETVLPAAHPKQNPRVDELLETALARPLFSSTRRPPQRTTDDSAADTDLTDKRLTGIVTVPGRHIAIFAVKDTKPLIVAEGDTVSGWRIDAIRPIEVSLSGPGGTKTLSPQPDPTLAQLPGMPTALPEDARPPGPPPAGDASRRRPPLPPNIAGTPLPWPPVGPQR
jgi:hypothetical protein